MTGEDKDISKIIIKEEVAVDDENKDIPFPECEELNNNSYNDVHEIIEKKEDLRKEINSNDDFENNAFDDDTDDNLLDRDYAYTDLVENYVKHLADTTKINILNRQDFYSLIKKLLNISFCAAVGIPLAYLFLVAVGRIPPSDFIIETVAIIGSSLAQVLVSILVLPKIVAKYLFNKEETLSVHSLIGKVQDYDATLREKRQVRTQKRRYDPFENDKE